MPEPYIKVRQEKCNSNEQIALLSEKQFTTVIPVCNILNSSQADKEHTAFLKQHVYRTVTNAVTAELVSLKCLIGDDVKMNGEVNVMDCKNGFVDLKNCLRSDGDCLKVEPLPVPSPSATESDAKQVSLADDSCMEVDKQMPTAQTEFISAVANPSELATNDSIQSSLCCKPDDDQLPRTPSKDDISLLQRSSMFQFLTAIFQVNLS